MRDESYDINDWVKFKKAHSDDWICGTIIAKTNRTDIIENDKIDLPEIKRYFYQIKYLKDFGEYETYTTDKNTVFKSFGVHAYIDLSNCNEADKVLLVGDAINAELYQATDDMFYNDYAVSCFDGM